MTILSGLLQELEAKNPSKKTKIHSHFVTQYLPIPTCWNPRICPEQIVLKCSSKIHVDQPDRSLAVEVIKLSNDHRQTNKESRRQKNRVFGSPQPNRASAQVRTKRILAFGPLGAGPDRFGQARPFPKGARRPPADHLAHSGRAFIVLIIRK